MLLAIYQTVFAVVARNMRNQIADCTGNVGIHAFLMNCKQLQNTFVPLVSLEGSTADSRPNTGRGDRRQTYIKGCALTLPGDC